MFLLCSCLSIYWFPGPRCVKLWAVHWKQWMWEQKTQQRTLYTWTLSVSKTEVSKDTNTRMHSWVTNPYIKLWVVIRVWMDGLCTVCVYVCVLVYSSPSCDICWGVKEAVFLHSFPLLLCFQQIPSSKCVFVRVFVLAFSVVLLISVIIHQSISLVMNIRVCDVIHECT